MNFLANPILVRMVIVFLCAAAAFILGVWLMRRLRRQMQSGLDLHQSADLPGFTLETYHGVIRRLKEQEEELKRLRQAASDRAAASENISSAIVSNLGSGVLLLSNAGTVQQANPAARDLLGYASPSGLHARDLFRGIGAIRLESGEQKILPGYIVEVVEQAIRQAAPVQRVEAEYVTPGGERRLLEFTFSAVRSAAGESLGAACLISDLTAIEELGRQARLRESLAELGEMSAGIAHEFKNSLATISGYGQMLTGESDPLVRQYSAKIVDETANLSRIVNDFLGFARPQELQLEAIELLPLLGECAHDSGVEIETGGLPEISVDGDRTALRQVFSNLLRNSAEAARNGSPARVVVSGECEGDTVRLVLRDNGHGIPAENLPRVFIPFYTTKAEGTGLGLALVHRIVSQHGGSVAVTSDDSGATFTLSFPARKLAENAAETG